MTSPVDAFVGGVRDGAYPGGQFAASKEGIRLIDTAAGTVAPECDPTDENVLYDLASLTKPLATTVLVARAMERGLCRLKDPIARFVPGVNSRITFQMALEHSAGFVAHQRFDRRLPPSIRPGTWEAYRAIVAQAATAPADRQPGEAAEYSDVGFILLGAALETLFRQPVSNTFALLETQLSFRDRRGPPAAAPVDPRVPFAPTERGLAGEVHDENARAMGGAAGHSGLFGTARGVLELANDLVAAYHGQKGGLLRPETVERLWRPSAVPGSTRTLGWDRPSAAGSSTGERWPSRAVGHLGFTGTSLWIEPERALVVVLVTNRVCPTRDNNAIRRIRPILHTAAWEAWAGA